MIAKTKTSCGCTVSEPEKTTLKPGETTNIKVTFYTAGKSGKESKDIHVYTNDPGNPEPTLKILANVLVPPKEPAKTTDAAKPVPAVDNTNNGQKFIGDWVATDNKKMKLTIKLDGTNYLIKGKKENYTSTFKDGALNIAGEATTANTAPLKKVLYNKDSDHITIDGTEYMRK